MSTDQNGSLIVCPNCARRLDKEGQPINQVLGRVMDDGNFMVLRFHHGTTILNVGSDYSVKCGCGYEYHVAHGTSVMIDRSEGAVG